MSVCASCSAENPKGAKFCGQCGTPLGLRCPACGSTAQTGTRFCIECGSSLEPTPPPSPEAAPASGERKQITVLFADVQGSMDLQEDLDPEVWSQIMGRFVAILAEGVRKYGGTVDKFTGDGIMALFGAPVAQEDHARRACHAAWHLTKAIAEYAEELRHDQGVDLNVRLGLNSGEVVVGRVGNDVTLDPTALGHTVGLAQRMEAMAEPGKAYLTQQTARLVEGWFRLANLGPYMIKGAREPVGVYALEGPASAPVRTGRTLGASPLVGRERELAALEDALAAAAEGQAQVVGVVGEAGIGKSRLCDEFAASAAHRGITVRHTAGVSHGRDVPLLPILSLLRDYFGISEANSADEARQKVTARLFALDPGLDQALPLLFDFLEVTDPHRPAPQLAADVRMRRIFETLRRISQRRSEREVLILLFEDLQWFDVQSESFLERLIESFPGSRTLVIANFRPGFSAPWMHHSYYRQLPLAPLGDEAVGELLSGVLGTDASLTPLVKCVLKRTAGNPFFVEELVRAFVEDGTITGPSGRYRLARPVQGVKLPPTVQAVLAARIDRLPSTQKSVLETAAVIGRTFSAAVLAKVTGLSEELLDNEVGALCRAELVHQMGADHQAEYSFWHPLTQEVAYAALLADRRTHLHAAAAGAIADVGPERADERAALVASHFERAGDALETARWNARAAAWALRTDLTEAVRRWRATIALLDNVADSDDALRLAVAARGRLLQLGSRTGLGIEEAARLYAEGKARAERLGDPALAATITRFFASVLLVAGRFGAARGRYLEAARLGDESGDRELQASVWFGPAFASIHSGAIPLGISAAERTRDLCQDDPECGTVHVGYSPLLRSRAYRAELLALGGRLEEATAEASDTLALARDRTDVEGVAWLLTTLVRLNDRRGTADDAGLVWATEAVRITEETGNLLFHMIARTALATAHLALGRFNDAIRIVDQTLNEIRGPRNPRYEEASALVILARAHLGDGHVDLARRRIDEAVQVAHRQEAKVLECQALLIRARVRRATGGEYDAAVADLDATLALVQETGALTYEPFIREELGRLHTDEVGLREALRLYKQIGAIGHARRLEAELTDGRRRMPAQRKCNPSRKEIQ